MEKSIAAAKKIAETPDKNWLEYLEEINLHLVFRPIYTLDLSIVDANLIVSFIIYAYDNDSQKINIQQDRDHNKLKICESIELDTTNEIVKNILTNNHDIANNVILNYLVELTTWAWQTILSQLDYHANIMRFVMQKTADEKTSEKTNNAGEKTTTVQDYDLSEAAKINKQKGELINMAIAAREKADELLLKIKKDFMLTDMATQSDMGFTFTDTAKKKIDVESWKDWRKEVNAKKQLTS